MTPPPSKRKLLRISITFLLVVGLLIGSLFANRIPLAKARPPANLKTIQDFRAWKTGSIQDEGTYQNSGVTYTVMLAPAGRFFPSGPSAYLFDEQGQFIDWTADMGDYYTVKLHLDLTGGQVKSIRRNE